MRKAYEMTDDQLNRLLDACKPVPYMVVGGMVPRSPQENANSAWQSLGVELGFDHMTVQPVRGKSDKFFTAEESAVVLMRHQHGSLGRFGGDGD